MGIDLTNCHFKDSGHAALILHSSIQNKSALSINTINEFDAECTEKTIHENNYLHTDSGLYGSHSMGNNIFQKITSRGKIVAFIYHHDTERNYTPNIVGYRI